MKELRKEVVWARYNFISFSFRCRFRPTIHGSIVACKTDHPQGDEEVTNSAGNQKL